VNRIRWSPRAADDLEAIYQFIARDSEHYARLTVARLVHAVGRLAKFPRSGRVVPEVGHRSLREIIDPPYRIVYRVASDDTVEVVTVFRTSRRFPDVVE